MTEYRHLLEKGSPEEEETASLPTAPTLASIPRWQISQQICLRAAQALQSGQDAVNESRAFCAESRVLRRLTESLRQRPR